MVDTPAPHSPAVSALLPVTPGGLAETLAARLCHDFMSPASGLVSGLDFLEDPGAQEMRAEALSLIASSARKLMDLLTFYRVALGGFAEGDDFDTGHLRSLLQGVFAHIRPELDWAVDVPIVSAAAARALLNLTHIAASALALGGVARVTVRRESEWTAVVVEADSPRARLHPEVICGLNGEPLGEGLAGRWVQAYCLHVQVSTAGGAVGAELGEGGILFKAVIPTNFH